jgi:hypothetical protein
MNGDLTWLQRQTFKEQNLERNYFSRIVLA